VQGVQARPHLQWTDAVVPARDERRPEWWIVSRILQEMGRPSLLDIPGGDVTAALWQGRLADAGQSLEALRAERVVPLAAGAQPAPLGDIPGDDFDCCPDALHEMLDRAEPIFEALAREDRQTLKLITRRTHFMLNSGFGNLKALRNTASGRTNPLYMSPVDAARLGLVDGQPVRVRNAHGELRAELSLDDALRPGVVAMSHGYGNEKTTGMPVARATPGVNVNVLSPTGAGSFDPVSAMSQLTGIAVEVSAAAGGVAS
jgi:anaerobic selenocysteine-containing dehydrogenase